MIVAYMLNMLQSYCAPFTMPFSSITAESGWCRTHTHGKRICRKMFMKNLYSAAVMVEEIRKCIVC